MLYDIQVRPGKDTGYFQYYTETVEAATSHDAISRVQRANPGCQVTCCKSYNKPKNSSSSSSSGDGSGAIGLVGLVAAGWAFMSFTPWILMLVGGAAGAWMSQKVVGQTIEDYNERDDGKGHKRMVFVLILTLLAGGFGFIKGDEIKKGFDAPTDTPAQVQQSK